MNGRAFAASFALATFFLSAPLRADPSVMDPRVGTASAGGGLGAVLGRPALAAVALRDVGATGPRLGLPSRLWCGDAINRWRRKAGLRVVPSRRAVDQFMHARRIARPVPGSLMISTRRGGAHVDVIAAVHDDGTVTVIRPNWSRRVVVARIRPYGRFALPT